jgi:hypothetical protein
MTRSRWRTTGFWIFTVACAIGVIGYIRWRVTDVAPIAVAQLLDPSDSQAASTIDALRSRPHLIFLSSRVDAPGQMAMTSLESLDPPILLAGPQCERGYAGKTFTLCLTLNQESMQPRGFALILDRRFQTVAKLPLAGLPIRARVSPDQRYAVATVFVTGESYGGDFTTRTTLIDLASKRAIADLEQFAVERDGKPFKAVDFNFWGVTFFQDGNQFFATLGTGGQRLLVKGDIAQRKLRVVTGDVECPSLSPDERHIVFKRQRKGKAGWQLWALELSTMKEWPITDDGQDIDDQVEWLDAGHVVYGLLYGSGAPDTTLSLWTSAIAPDSDRQPRLFMRSGWSPSVLH